MDPAVPCPVCGRPGPVVLAGSREATHGTVAALVERAPVVSCPDGHRAAAPLGGPAASSCLARLPHARPQRRRWGRVGRVEDRCGACDTPLTMPVRRSERAVTLDDLDGVGVLTLRLDVPTTRCPACGLDQVPTRSVPDVTAAVEALFTPGRP